MKHAKRALSLLLCLLIVFATFVVSMPTGAVDLSNEYRLITNGTYVYNVPLGVTAAELMATVYNTAVLKTSDGTVVDKNSDAVICTGMTLSYTYVEYILAVNGDLNGDGLCSSTDFLQLEKAVSGAAIPESATFAGDVDADGLITATDLLISEKAITGGGSLDGNCYLTDEEKQNIVLTEPGAIELEDGGAINFNGTKITTSGAGVSVVDNYAYITAPGEYTVTGSGTDSYVRVNAGLEDHVSLTLSGVTLSNSTGPAIFFEQCKHAYIKLADGTTSTLSDGTTTTLTDKGAIFANDTLDIMGTGSLVVTGNKQHAIASDDDIVIADANVTVKSAVKDAFHANDDITVLSGSVTVTTAGSDALESEGTINVNGGSLTLSCPAGTALKAGTVYTSTAGNINIYNAADGIKGGTELNVDGGTYTVNVTDNAFKGTVTTNVNDGNIKVVASDTGIKGDTQLNINGGTINITCSNNALKSDFETNVKGGDLTINSTGDGIKASSVDATQVAGEVRTTFTYDSLNGSVSTSGCYIHNGSTVNNTAVYWFVALASSNGDGTYTVKSTLANGVAKTFTTTSTDIAVLAHQDNSNYASACMIQVGDVISYNTSTRLITVTTSAANVGTVNITGGNQYISAAYDAVEAGENVYINNTDAGRTSNTGIGSGSYNMYVVCGGGASSTSIDTATYSYKAIKSDNNIIIDNIKLYASTPEDTIKSDVYVEINGGTMDIYSGRDGISATDCLCLNGGNVTVKTKNGYSTSLSSSDTNSYKALKGTGSIIVSGGTYNLNCPDDAVHSNGPCTISGGNFSIYTGDDAFHSDTTMTINGGTTVVHNSYEGVEGLNVYISAGSVIINSSDDGVNAAGGADGSGAGGMRPGRPGSSSSSGNYSINFSGTAFVWMNTTGDGADSNGAWNMSGGTVIIQQSQTNDNSGVDSDGTVTISGGLLIVCDCNGGMESLTASNFTQYGVRGTYTGSANTLIGLTNSSGSLIFAYKPTVSYKRIIISSPQFSSGSTYNLYTGGSCSGTVTQGLYTSGTYSSGTLKKSFSISSSKLTTFSA
ncbi:MAG: carbohydrate-binding domain-containing protein [Clostridia bacterium]|nr:carbohydrate-binding domain-containing protein [Clostridia bacterium]